MLYINQRNVNELQVGLKKYIHSTKNIARGLRHLLLPFLHRNQGKEVLVMRTLVDSELQSYFAKDHRTAQIGIVAWAMDHLTQYREYADKAFPEYKKSLSMMLENRAGIITPDFYFVFPADYQDLTGRQRQNLAKAVDDAISCYVMGIKTRIDHIGVSEEEVKRQLAYFSFSLD